MWGELALKHRLSVLLKNEDASDTPRPRGHFNAGQDSCTMIGNRPTEYTELPEAARLTVTVEQLPFGVSDLYERARGVCGGKV